MSNNQTLSRLKEVTAILDELEEEFISKKEREVFLLLNALTDMVLVIDSTGTVKYANPSSYRVLGYDPNHLIGMHQSQLFGDVSLSNHVDTTIRLIAKRQEGQDQPVFVYVGEMQEISERLLIVVIRKGPEDNDTTE